MLLLVIMSQWVCFSPSTMVSFHHHRCWLLFFGVFLVASFHHECNHSFGLLCLSDLLCWAIILLPNNPPLKPDSGIILFNDNDAVDGNQSCSDTIPLSSLIAVDGPPFKNRPGSIMRQRRADSVRRWEHPQDLASTILWPSTSRLLSMPQPLGDRGISPIQTSGRTQVLGVEGNYKSAAVFTGQYRPPHGLGLPLHPWGGKICWCYTYRSSGFGSPVYCYILRSATASLDR